MIEAINIEKKYGKIPAVTNLNLQVSNELFVFLGPNGAGKTTTIKMMTGLCRPTAGQIIIGGYDLWQNPQKAKRSIGLVPDTPFLYEKLSGREFLQFMAAVYQVDHSTTRKRINDLLELFELAQKADQLIETYSLGMKRKCAICGALVHNPEILFLDEPTASLDPKSARKLKAVLTELVRRGTTIFFSTHILEIAEQMCDRVGIINKGQLIACGTMAELRRRSQNNEQSLEDIFFELTDSDNDQADVLKYFEA